MNVKLYLLKSIIFAKPFSFLDSFYQITIKKKHDCKIISIILNVTIKHFIENLSLILP